MRKFLKFKTLYAGLFIVLIALLASCSSDEIYDFPGDSNNRVYLSGSDNYSFSVYHTPIGSLGDIKVMLPAFCTREASTDLKVSFAVDTTLVSAYNKTHSTQYSAIPSDLVVFSGNGLTIAKGSRVSQDSLTVTIPENLSKLKDEKYLVPITISTLGNAGNAAASTNKNVVYLTINTFNTNCFNSPVQSDMVGTLIQSRTAWTASLNITAYYNALSRLFDGSTTTYSYVYPSQPCALTIDMASEYKGITGIRLNSYSTSYGITKANIYSSSDGITWTSQGIANLSTASAYQYIKFYSPISARYIKLDVTAYRSTYYIRFGEFDIYTNN